MSQLREIVFDTETTGFHTYKGDRLVEIGAIELINHVPSGKEYHTYIDPQRDVPIGAYKVHKLSTEFLRGKPLFKDAAQDFIDFVGDSPMIAHNASFDMGFINMELEKAGFEKYPSARFIDTLKIARNKFPHARSNTLDALCDRFEISRKEREAKGHGALLDSLMLAKVYLELIGGKSPALLKMEKDKDKDENKNGDSADLSTEKKFREPRDFPISQEEIKAHDTFLDTFKNQPMWKQQKDRIKVFAGSEE